jgi:hypothetical protein
LLGGEKMCGRKCPPGTRALKHELAERAGVRLPEAESELMGSRGIDAAE